MLGNNVAGFDFHDIIRFAFAATLGLGTISTAYFSDETEPPEYDEEPANPRERKRREREAVYFASMQNAAPHARRAMWLFAFLDGTFNLADAAFGASSTGLLDMALHGKLVYIYGGATFLFGVAPTILAIVLSKVISMVDRIPEDYERPASRRQMDLLRTIMGNLGLRRVHGRRGGRSLRFAEPNSRTEPRLPAPHRNGGGVGEQAARIYEYMDIFCNPSHIPTLMEIRDALDDPKPSKSTISVARNEWLQRHRSEMTGGTE